MTLPASGEFTIAGLAAGDYDLLVPIGCRMYTPYEQQGVRSRPAPKRSSTCRSPGA